jgi:hypothetical protein
MQMLPNLSHVDPNDPRNANLLRFKEILLPSEFTHSRFRTVENYFQMCFASNQGIFLDYRYVSVHPPGLTPIPPQNSFCCCCCLNGSRYEEPRRHELIRLRRHKPESFTAPIPLRSVAS